MVNFHDPKVIQSDAGTFSLFSLGLCASSSQDELKLLLGTFRLFWLAFFCTSQNVLQVCKLISSNVGGNSSQQSILSGST